MTERSVRIAAAALLFAYVLAIRTYDVATTFLMLGEQTRDWIIALGGITDLPLTGAPSTAGGRGLGPVYYWLLWIGRITLGPFADNLPHAGGFFVALLQSIADAWLFMALSRRIPWTLALASCLLIASAPFDIALSSLIWNPPVAAALIKMATATALSLTAASPLSHVAAAAALAWMAAQTHLSGIFVAAPLLLALPFHGGSTAVLRTVSDRLRVAGLVAGVVLALQVPFLVAVITEPAAAAGPISAIEGLTNPQVFRPWLAYDSVTGITGNLLLPLDAPAVFAVAAAIAIGVVAFCYRRDPIVLAVTAGGVIAATLLFTTSARAYDGYWFVTLTTALTLLFAMAVAAIPSRPAVTWMGAALLLAVAWRQPARIEDSTRFFKYPQYETMVRASRELMTKAPVVRDITVAFDMHPTMDRHFVYTILGGRIEPGALYTAIVNADGSVRLE
jgi:hypothetical protein